MLIEHIGYPTVDINIYYNFFNKARFSYGSTIFSNSKNIKILDKIQYKDIRICIWSAYM